MTLIIYPFMQEKKGMWLRQFNERNGMSKRDILTQGTINTKLVESLIKGKAEKKDRSKCLAMR